MARIKNNVNSVGYKNKTFGLIFAVLIADFCEERLWTFNRREQARPKLADWPPKARNKPVTPPA
tara:strand:+ start:80 stop:271 length:192 start_codon:yes stop_codon:yes gene_type:complete